MSDARLRTLGEDGATAVGEAPDLPRTELLELYRVMSLARAAEGVIRDSQHAGEVSFYVSGAGTEAVAVGATAALKPDDWIYPSLRLPAVPLMRGIAPAELMHQVLGTAEDRCRGRATPGSWGFAEARVVSISAPIGTQLAQAVGTAAAARLSGDTAVVLAIFGDAALASPDFHSACNFAGVLGAPVVLLCTTTRDDAGVADRAPCYGIASSKVDGLDVLAVFEAVAAAVAVARGGGGATLIEALTDASPARTDPIERFGRFLRARELADEALDLEIREATRRDAREAARLARAAPPADARTLFGDVLASTSPVLARQRDACERFGGEYGGENDPDARFLDS